MCRLPILDKYYAVTVQYVTLFWASFIYFFQRHGRQQHILLRYMILLKIIEAGRDKYLRVGT